MVLCFIKSTLVILHLNLAPDFDVAEGCRVLLDVQRTQQRVRGASEQLERVSATFFKKKNLAQTKYSHKSDKKQAQTGSPGRRSESFSLPAVGKSLWTDEEEEEEDILKILWTSFNQTIPYFRH